jgi:putative peptide zinc metalloprotease protein
MRPDVTAVRQSYQGRDYWVLKDPLSLKYYRFEEEEYRLLLMIDGKRSPDQIKRQFDFDYAPQKLTLQELYQFAGMLYRSSLLISNSADQGIELKKRGEKNRSQEFRQSITNVLALRLRGFDPDALLTRLNPWTAWFFTWPAFLCVFLLGGSALALLLTQFETFQNKLPSFENFFASGNWIWLAIVMALTKVAHEFGHGLACKRFGGQCHEMGVMFLVLTPCLYVNVSDSWLLPSKWQRAFIAAAGMYVELVLAAIAVFVWWFSAPGLINQLALNVIFVSSVTTLLFNANPLLRYDGYYILSDLLEIPNLRSKASLMLQRTCGRWLLGIETRPDPFLPVRRKWLFITYSLAAVAYRWIITISIFWFVYRILEPYGLKVVGQLLALSAIYGLIGMPLARLFKFFSVPGRMGTVKTVNFATSVAVAAALLFAIGLIPIPHHVCCSFYVQPSDAANVFVQVPGRLVEIHATANERVTRGQPIVTLQSPELIGELASMETQVNVARSQFMTVSWSAATDPSAADSLEEAEASYNNAVASMFKRAEDLDRLIVRAPTDGFLLSPPELPDENPESGKLGRWNGTPLEPRNLGAWVDRQTLIGKIVTDPSQMEAILAIDQSEIEFVQPDQTVELLVHQLPAVLHNSLTQTISPTKMLAVPRQLSSRHGGDLLTRVDGDGNEVPDSTTYLVSVPLDNPDQKIVAGSTGVAKIRVGSQTVGQRLCRWIGRTFQFEL